MDYLISHGLTFVACSCVHHLAHMQANDLHESLIIYVQWSRNKARIGFSYLMAEVLSCQCKNMNESNKLLMGYQ